MEKGVTGDEYRQLLLGTNIKEISYRLAVEIAESIKNRTIPAFKTGAGERYDPVSEKTRLIGHESCEQRLYDYVAVFGADELWRKKLVYEQCSSLKGRGALYGVRIIKKCIDRNRRNIDYCKKHGLHYTDKCRYFVKLDIKHCYPSVDIDLLIGRLERDVNNADMLYLWKSLLRSYKETTTGLLIGALPSQWISQYLIAEIYRYAKIHGAGQMVLYMDDMLLFGSNRRKLRTLVESMIDYADKELHLTIKHNYSIKRLAKEPVDMMGYVVHENGEVTIRSKTFIHARRMILRVLRKGFVTYSQAKRLTSYKGFFKYSNCMEAKQKYQLNKVFTLCSQVISQKEKRNGLCNFKQ